MLLCDKLYGKSYNGRVVSGSMDMADLLLSEEKVAVTPGVCFGDDDAVRLSYALSLADMEEGLRRIADLVKKIK
jgi:aspartate aminotransferase